MKKVIISDTGKAVTGMTGAHYVDVLPQGYRELIGITFDGDFHYATTLRLKGSDTLRFAYSATAAGNVIGCYSGSTSSPNFSYYHAASAYMRHGTTLARPSMSNNTRYDIVCTPTGATGFPSSITWTESTFEVNGNFFIGMLDNSTSAALKGNMYGRVTIDGRALFVPVEDPDGYIGYYDLVSDTFISKTGSGTPVSLGYL